MSWVGRDRALSPPERAKPGSPLPPGGEGACRPWQAACMAQTSSPGPPPALGPENGSFVGSGLDGQLTWPGRQLPARSRWPGPHGEGCGAAGWSGPGAGVPVKDLRLLCPGLRGPVGQEVGMGPACVAVFPELLQACCPGWWPSGDSWRQGCVCPAVLPASWPCARPTCPFSLECSPGGWPPPSPALPQVHLAIPAPGFSGRSGDTGFPFCGLQGPAALKSALPAHRGPRTGHKP